MIAATEFREIAHSGGQVTFRTVTEPDRKPEVSDWVSAFTPHACLDICSICPSRKGVAVGTVKLGGIGQPWNPPPVPGCVPVFIASDSEGTIWLSVPGLQAILASHRSGSLRLLRGQSATSRLSDRRFNASMSRSIVSASQKPFLPKMTANTSSTLTP